MSHESAFKLKERLLVQEKDLVATQNEWLTQELNSKSEQLIELRKEHFTTIRELKCTISSKEEEVMAIGVGWRW